MAYKLTFKKQKAATGLRAVGNGMPNTNIKANGKYVGEIVAPNWMTKDRLYGIRFAVKKNVTEEDPAAFGWITLKARAEMESDARALIIRNWEKICEKYDLYLFEDFMPE